MSPPPIHLLITQIILTDWQNIIRKSPSSSQNFGSEKQQKPLRRLYTPQIIANYNQLKSRNLNLFLAFKGK